MGRANGRRSRKKWWWTGGILLLLVVVIAVVARPKAGEEGPQSEVKLAKAEVGNVQVRVTEVGSVEPLVKVDVKSALSGKIVDLLVREGDTVRRGEVLARVEPDVNQARDLAQVKNAVHDAEIALNEARSTYERNKNLLAQGLLSDQSGLESETRFMAAQASYDAAVEKYRIVQESGVPIALADAATTQRLNVTSPMDGVVIRRPVELGDTVMSGVSSFNAGTVLMTVADLSSMIVKAGINEVDIGKVRVGQHVRISLDAYPKVRFEGVIERIAPAARLDEKVKVFDVEIAVDRQGAELRTGMTANVDVVGERREKVLTVPVEALFRKDETEIVYLKRPPAPQVAATPGLIARVFAADDKSGAAVDPDEKDRWKEQFEAREVKTGLASFEKVQILEGLDEGDEIAVEDPTRPKGKDDGRD